MCIEIVEIRFGIANGQISSRFDEVICPRHNHIFVPDDNLSECQGILTKLGTCTDIKEIWFGIDNGQISSILTELTARGTIMTGYCHFILFLGLRESLPYDFIPTEK